MHVWGKPGPQTRGANDRSRVLGFGNRVWGPGLGVRGLRFSDGLGYWISV